MLLELHSSGTVRDFHPIGEEYPPQNRFLNAKVKNIWKDANDMGKKFLFCEFMAHG